MCRFSFSIFLNQWQKMIIKKFREIVEGTPIKTLNPLIKDEKTLINV